MKIYKIILMFCFIYLLNFSLFSKDNVLIHYHEAGQTEIIKGNKRILIDIGIPSNLTREMRLKDEVLLTTCRDNDHYDIDFKKDFKGKQLFIEKGEIKTKDYYIKSISTYYTPDDAAAKSKYTNFIYIIEIGGLRIGHFGDLGIDSFTDEELKEIGEVDVAITQLVHRPSNYSLKNQKGFNIIKQIKPKIVIPTHMDEDNGDNYNAVVEKGIKMFSGMYSGQKFIELSKSKLPKETTLILSGPMAKAFGKIYKLEEFK